jgi:endo-1,4-beta-xylanase
MSAGIQSSELGSRRQFLSTLASLGAVGAVSKTLSPLGKIALAAEQTLRDLAAQKGLLYGCATAQEFLQSDPEFARLFTQQCGLLVPENALNWRYTEPRPGVFDFHMGDWLLNFAKTNNMKFGGGFLVWHQGLPPWLSSLTPQNALEAMQNHIRQTVSHYRGRAFSWRVVNEAAAFRGSRTELRDTPFLRLVGPDYIEAAFRAAAEADPDAMLVYNENHVEYDTPGDEFGRTTVLNLLKRLVSSKVPIGALGIQSHLKTGNAPFSATKLRDFLSRVADLGLKISVTELDVTEAGPETKPADRDAAVAREVERYLGVVLQEKAVIAVVTWGLSARYTWLANYAPRPDGQPVRPLPYDSNLHPTLAWQALATAFERAPKR